MYRFERWRAAIQAAPTKAAVQKVIRDYLDAIMPSDLGRMPPECHLPLAKGDEDVEGAAVELVRFVPGETGGPAAPDAAGPSPPRPPRP